MVVCAESHCIIALSESSPSLMVDQVKSSDLTVRLFEELTKLTIGPTDSLLVWASDLDIGASLISCTPLFVFFMRPGLGLFEFNPFFYDLLLFLLFSIIYISFKKEY